MKSGDTLILDNYSVHKIINVLDPIIQSGINIVFLPPCSPAFSPVELAWAKIKAYLRKIKSRTFDSLIDSLSDALASITNDDIMVWVNHCGYWL